MEQSRLASQTFRGSAAATPVILYEYPFHEGIRTMLRLEQLFERLGLLRARETAVDHHYALATIFEILDVSSRADLKSDVLKELDKHRTQFAGYRGNPSISEAALDAVIGQIDRSFDALNEVQGKAGAAIATDEWLMSIRSRIAIPGGTCGFDLPSYHAWQHLDPVRRQHDLMQWSAPLLPLAEALRLLLGLMRESGVPHKVVAPGGQYQQSLPQGRAYQLLRVRLDGDEDIVPEITGHRLMVSVRLMRQDAERRLRPSQTDTTFELTLCA